LITGKDARNLKRSGELPGTIKCAFFRIYRRSIEPALR